MYIVVFVNNGVWRDNSTCRPIHCTAVSLLLLIAEYKTQEQLRSQLKEEAAGYQCEHWSDVIIIPCIIKVPFANFPYLLFSCLVVALSFCFCSVYYKLNFSIIFQELGLSRQ